MRISLLPLLALAAAVAPPRAEAQDAAPLAGTFTGTSVCLVNRGVCHDEVVVYRVSAADAEDSAQYTITMHKLVDGHEEEDMAVVGCRVSGDGHTLTCPMPPQFRPATWSFSIDGDTLSGWLTAPDGTRIRRIEARAGTGSAAEAPPPAPVPAAARADIAIPRPQKAFVGTGQAP
jgi:hypothetical protein